MEWAFGMTGKTVLITGSSKGLGKSLAIEFARNGFNIILHGRDERELRKAEEEVLEHNVACDVVRGEITDDKTIDELTQIAEQRNIDVLINNAGVYLNAPFQDMSPQDFKRVIGVNLIAPIILTRRIYPILQKKQAGIIVNINSLAGKNPTDGESAYCASKHGLRGFTKSIQYEANKDNLSIIEVYLGTMNTSMVKGRRDPQKCIQTEEAAECIFELCKQYPSMRIGEIEVSRRRY